MPFFRRKTTEERAARSRIREAKDRLRVIRADAGIARTNVRLAKDDVRAAKDRARQVTAVAKAEAAVTSERLHTSTHSSPSHHVGPCDAACRAGKRAHAHRRG